MKLYILPKTLTDTQRRKEQVRASPHPLYQLQQVFPISEHGGTLDMNKTICKYIQQDATMLCCSLTDLITETLLFRT